jgi:chromosome segregation ATPase
MAKTKNEKDTLILSDVEKRVKKNLEILTLAKWETLKIGTQYQYANVSEKLPNNPLKTKFHIDIGAIKEAYRASRRLSRDQMKPDANSSSSSDSDDDMNIFPSNELLATSQIIQDFSLKFDQLFKDNKKLNQKSELQEKEIARLNNDLDSYDRDLAVAENKIKILEDKTKQHDLQIETLQKDHEKVTRSLLDNNTELNQKLDQLRKEFDLEKSASRRENEELRSKFERENEELKSKYDQLRKEFESFATALPSTMCAAINNLINEHLTRIP